jgi:hypothetical protein
LLLVGWPLHAALILSGSSLDYQPLTSGRADASLQEIRSRALSGNLTTDDILKAAEQIRAVQVNTNTADASAPVVTPSAEPATPAPTSSSVSVYNRAGTDLQIPVDDSASPLGALGRVELSQALDRLPLRHLFLVNKIQVAAPVNDPARGQLVVRTEGNNITLYGTSDLDDAATQGVAAVAYESMRGSPLEAEWQTHGDFADFVQTYQAWVENTQGAFDQAKESDQSSAELSKVFFVASLFSDDSSNRITTYDPSPKAVAWQVQGDHYGFGPYTFDVYHNQIVHLAQNGVPLSASAADIPSLWNLQGLGN